MQMRYLSDKKYFLALKSGVSFILVTWFHLMVHRNHFPLLTAKNNEGHIGTEAGNPDH